MYVNKDFLGSPNNVFVSVFPTGKCTVTAAPSVHTANKVTEGKQLASDFENTVESSSDSVFPIS